jgi:hypothetical protein
MRVQLFLSEVQAASEMSTGGAHAMSRGISPVMKTGIEIYTTIIHTAQLFCNEKVQLLLGIVKVQLM